MKKQTLILLMVPIVILTMTVSTFGYCPPVGSVRDVENSGDDHPWGGENAGPAGDGGITVRTSFVMGTAFFFLDIVWTICQVKIMPVQQEDSVPNTPMIESEQSGSSIQAAPSVNSGTQQRGL
ncbi:MAG: hypothetical protein JSV44_03910 [Candidatus Zixiibacteriota bacterium]|nr:MAG: hypothetical protein JSV44_03910 [candidate division Zixibacteria bacterium]